MPDIVLKNISKRFGSFEAVKNLNLEIHDRDYIILLGPSGCGKTTTLRLIAGLETPTEGEILIDQRIVFSSEKGINIPPDKRDVGFLFQNYALWPHMTVYQNMAYGLKLRKIPKDQIDAQVQQTASILGLEEYLDRKPKQLSGGQRQRVALGRAIVRKPQVFLFDEPLSNLDAKLRILMRAEISKLHKKLDTTMIYVTHDQVEAMTMGDRITVLNDGIIQQCDTPLNLYDHPKNLFVAGFIGSPGMNMISGNITSEKGLSFTAKGIIIPIPAEYQKDLQPYIQKPVILGVRPENIYIDSQAATKAIVEVVEPMGNEIIVYLAVGDSHILMRMEERLPLKPDDVVNIAFKDLHLHFFDKATEECINFKL